MRAVLFVDDHQVLADLSCEILAMKGYRAVSAYSGKDALAKLEQDEFDVLVADVRMEGMSGLELAGKARQKRPQLPVILITGYDPVPDDKDVAACLQKESLFPALLEQIDVLVSQEDEDEPDIARSA